MDGGKVFLAVALTYNGLIVKLTKTVAAHMNIVVFGGPHEDRFGLTGCCGHLAVLLGQIRSVYTWMWMCMFSMWWGM